MALGPRAYYLRHVLKSNVLKPSKPMIVGQAFEDAICGRDTFKVIEGDGRTKLVKQQKEEAKELGREYKPVATIICDHEIPYRMISEVVYTAGMAGLSELNFAIIKTSTR